MVRRQESMVKRLSDFPERVISAQKLQEDSTRELNYDEFHDVIYPVLDELKRESRKLDYSRSFSELLGRSNKFLHELSFYDFYEAHFEYLKSLSGKDGRFSKRFQKLMFQTYGIKPSKTVLAVVSDTISRFASPTEMYWDYTTKMDWRRGTFESDDSCYWTVKAGALDWLNANPNAYALRTFTANGEPKGRCWVVEVKDGEYIIFNAYGYQLSDYAFLLSEILKAPKSAEFRLNNFGCYDGHLWINQGKGFGIGKEFSKLTEYDFGVEIDYREASSCYRCEEYVHEDSLIFVPSEDVYYCEDCAAEYLTNCDRCNEYHTYSYFESEFRYDSGGTLLDWDGNEMLCCSDCARSLNAWMDSYTGLYHEGAVSAVQLPPDVWDYLVSKGEIDWSTYNQVTESSKKALLVIYESLREAELEAARKEQENAESTTTDN